MSNNTGAKNRKEGGGMGKGAKIAIITVAALIVILAAVLVGFGSHASNLDTSLPGIKLNNIELGGLTRDQIAAELSGMTAKKLGYETLTVNFEGDVSFDITPSDAGADNIGDKLADVLYNYGKNGGLFSNALNYIGSSIFGTELSVGDVFEIDEENVKSIVSTNATVAMENANKAFHIDEEEGKLYVTKGAEAITIVPDNVYKKIEAAYKEMNFEPITYEADSSQAKTISIDDLHASICTELKNATYNKETGEITEDSKGINFDLQTAKDAFEAAADGETIAIPVDIEYPKTSAEVLRTRLFADVLAEKRTSLTSNYNRTNNIRLASKAINGLILNPGDEFSFNGTVGQRTAAKGYLSATAYVSGESVPQIGGGICQVSSTLYYCTLMANLKVTDRDEHMFTVSYLPLGMDATVNWPNLDYKFVNSSNYPVKIEMYVEGSWLYVKLLGTQERTDGHYFKLDYTTVGSIPRGEKIDEDPTLAPGTEVVESNGWDGKIVKSYRYEYDKNGNLVNTEYIAQSTYKAKDKHILRGPELVDEGTSGGTTGGEGTGTGTGGETTGGEGAGTGGETTGGESAGAGGETTDGAGSAAEA